MKHKLIIITLLYIFSLSSCIKEEALNKEADILKIVLPEKILERQAEITNDEIICYAKSDADLTQLAPIFQLTEGATISPKSGEIMDFSQPCIYTVQSQDKQWSKKYTITFIKSTISEKKYIKYHFDNYKLKENKYYQFYEVNDNNTTTFKWASGNSGYTFIAGNATPEEYPTSVEKHGFKNSAVKLTTIKGDVNHAVIAGSLFSGVFKLNAFEPLKSTHFGVIFTNEPVKLKGYYKYKSGDNFLKTSSSTTTIVDRRDSCSLYAVFYETNKETTYLDGTNILTNENIISIARLSDTNEVDDWTFFELPFVVRKGKSIDTKKLKTGKYNLAIVLSSSKDGDTYNGAIGSTLIVDEVEIEIKK